MKTIPVINKDTSPTDEVGFKIQFKPFNKKLAAEIVIRVSNGESLQKIMTESQMPSFIELKLWKKQSPDFANMLNEAKKVRAEKLSEDLVSIANELKERIISEEGLVRTAYIEKLYKITERITSLHDEDQNLSKSAQININNQPVQVVIDNPYKGKHEDKNLDDYRVDQDKE